MKDAFPATQPTASKQYNTKSLEVTVYIAKQHRSFNSIRQVKPIYTSIPCKITSWSLGPCTFAHQTAS